MSLERDYAERYGAVLGKLATRLREHIQEILAGAQRVDAISARPKDIDRFLAKASITKDGIAKYADPMSQIQDQVGARVTVLYLADVQEISAELERFLRPVEARNLVPESESEFSYFGRHYVFLIPEDVLEAGWDRRLIPEFFELQVKTLFQHAWSEASHDLTYKPNLGEVSSEDKRLLAYASAQAWGADKAFDEILRHLTVPPEAGERAEP